MTAMRPMPTVPQQSRMRSGQSAPRAFTLTEMLVVLFVVMILLGLMVGVMGYLNTRAHESRATAEIRVLRAALGAYKLDNGFFPANMASYTTSSSTLDYTNNAGANSQVLYRALFWNPDRGIGIAKRAYYTFRVNQLKTDVPGAALSGCWVVDPWGRPYNYDSQSAWPNPRKNVDFDLWSAGKDGLTDRGTATYNSDDIHGRP
jgi:type II secretory pathway pseudopilin PulG